MEADLMRKKNNERKDLKRKSDQGIHLKSKLDMTTGEKVTTLDPNLHNVTRINSVNVEWV